MRRTYGALAIAAGVVVAVVLAGCGGSSSGATGGGDGSAGIGIDLAYEGAATPRAEGFARTLAASTSSSDPAPRPPTDTWLRVTITGPGFSTIVCQFPRRTGGECGGIPAGNGRTVVVEEWDASFSTLYYRGLQGGVVVLPGRSTRVSVSMRPPVVIQHPAAEGGVNLARFTAVVQSEPHAKVMLYLGTHLVGSQTADEHGVAEILVLEGDPTVAARTDGILGLPDGDYLLTAVALPPAAPGGALVKYQGAPHAFVVDLVRPTLALSAPSLTSASAVDVSGVTEPRTRVRCGRDAPTDENIEVGADGRFVLTAFPVVAPTTRIVCKATDRAGNTTSQEFVVAYLPDGFAIHAELPDVTRSGSETLRVKTDPSVEDLQIDVVGALGASRTLVVAGQSEDGSFVVPVELFANQWNRVRVSARVGGVTLGSSELGIEHDDLPPLAPTASAMLMPDWTSDSSLVTVVADRYYVDFTTIVMSQPEPGGTVEIYYPEMPVNWVGLAGDGGALLDPTPHVLFGVTNTGVYPVPSGTCFAGLFARAVDRAGNVSRGWNLASLPAFGYAQWCVR